MLPARAPSPGCAPERRPPSPRQTEEVLPHFYRILSALDLNPVEFMARAPTPNSRPAGRRAHARCQQRVATDGACWTGRARTTCPCSRRSDWLSTL